MKTIQKEQLVLEPKLSLQFSDFFPPTHGSKYFVYQSVQQTKMYYDNTLFIQSDNKNSLNYVNMFFNRFYVTLQTYTN